MATSAVKAALDVKLAPGLVALWPELDKFTGHGRNLGEMIRNARNRFLARFNRLAIASTLRIGQREERDEQREGEGGFEKRL